MIGIVYAGGERLAPRDCPAAVSTNQLPSRKIRGRIFSVASVWIGRPFRFDFHVHHAGVALALDRGDLARRSRPAMRTGDLGWMLTAVANTAFRRKPCLNGMCLVKPK